MVHYSSHHGSIKAKQLFNAQHSNSQSAYVQVERVLEAVSCFTNPFSSSFEDNEGYFLSFGAPAKPGLAKTLIEADDIGKNAVADFIDSLLVENLSSQPHKMLPANRHFYPQSELLIADN